MKVRKSPLFYISLVGHVVTTGLIIFQSCLSSTSSHDHTDFFASISAWVVNTFRGPQETKLIEPNALVFKSDSSVLGYTDQTANIAVGTTSLLTLQVNYPEKDSVDKYNYSYNYERIVGSSSDYSVSISSRTSGQKMYIDMRVTTYTISETPYQIDVSTTGNLKYQYKFNSVELPAPIKYETKLDKTTFKIGEVSKVDLKLTGDKRNDYYLKRYYDPTKLSFSSSNPSIATIDKFGYVKAISNGTATIKYGASSYEITVLDETIPEQFNKVEIAKSEQSNTHLSVYDYDYVFSDDNDPNMYSVVLSLNNDEPVVWTTDDKLTAFIAPFKYDENDYPVYKDDNGNSAARICGYRNRGDVNIVCQSVLDENKSDTITLNSSGAQAASMTINITNDITLKVNEQKAIKGTFSPKNTANTSLKVESDNDNVEILNNNSGAPAIRGTKAGNSHIKVTSLSNPELVKEFNVTVEAEQAINDKNYDSFYLFIRKYGGHMMLFLVNAVFAYLFAFAMLKDKKYRYWLPIAIALFAGFALSGISELIQMFVPGRSALWSDIGIDMLGVSIGVALTLVVIFTTLGIKKLKTHLKDERSKKADNN